MFVADLLIVGLWALFTWHFVWGRIVPPAMIMLRIALSFMMYRKSRWAFSNALLFAVMYAGIIFDLPSIDMDFEPIGKMAYVFCCLIGFSDWAVKAFDYHNHIPIQVPLYILWGLYTAWLIIMPIICSWSNKRILPILKRRKRILWYIGSVLVFTAYLYLADRDAMIFSGGLLLSLTPPVYRCIYHKGKQSILQTLLQDKILMSYLAIATVLFGAVLIGLYEVNGAKPFASFFFPIALYVIALRLCKARSVNTLPAILLGIVGFIQMLVYNRFHENVIILLSVAGVLSCIGVFLTYRQSRSIFASLLLLVTSTFVLPLTLLGYNPYAAIEVNEVRSFGKNIEGRCGLYQFQQCGSIGLRDRYGIVLYANYDKMEFLGDKRYERDYLVLYKYVKDWKDFAIEGIYDLKNRKNILPESFYGYRSIEMLHDKVYAIYDHDGNHVYTFRLPGVYDWGYDCDMRLIACDGESGKKVELPEDLSNMKITKSDDGKITLYAYDTGCGGTSPAYETYIQYEAYGKTITDYIYPLTESDFVCASDIKKDGVDIYDGSYTTFVAEMPLSDTETGYLIDACNKASNTEGGQEVCLLKFIDGKLKKLPFVSKGGEISNSVGCYYYIPDWYFTTDGLGWDWVMSFDKETGTLYVPEEGEMVMTDHYDLYRYKDGKMRHDGYGAGFWLHPSLHDFNYLVGIYQTDTNLIRIDRLDVGEGCRYASWQKSEPMSSKPDLVLYGGKTDIVENAIVFENGNYTYIVPEYRRGQWKDFGKVIIKYKDKVIQEWDV